MIGNLMHGNEKRFFFFVLDEVDFLMGKHSVFRLKMNNLERPRRQADVTNFKLIISPFIEYLLSNISLHCLYKFVTSPRKKVIKVQ